MRLKVVAFDVVNLSSSDTSDFFSIYDLTPPTISVVSPGTGFSIPEYFFLTAIWNATDNIGVDNVQLEYYIVFLKIMGGS